MKPCHGICATAFLAGLFTIPCRATQDDDVADIPSQDLRAGKDRNKRYFLIGPAKDAKPPKKGYRLLLVLPGGPGSAAFHGFVKRIYKRAVPEGYLVAQPVAVNWIVWPTEKDRAEAFSTEAFVDAVIGDVGTRHKLDPEYIFTLSWSSSGPAAYALSLSSKKVTGSFIAMSVFRPERLPPLDKSRGHAYFLFHSPGDQVCPFEMAKQAADDLTRNGAKVKLVTYQGEHGWPAGLYERMREGIQWLEQNKGGGKDVGPVLRQDGLAGPHAELEKRITSAPARAMKQSGLAGATGGARVRVISTDPQEVLLPIPQLADGQVPVCYFLRSTPSEAATDFRFCRTGEGNAAVRVRLAGKRQDVQIAWSSVVLLAPGDVTPNRTPAAAYRQATACVQSGAEPIRRLATDLWPKSGKAASSPRTSSGTSGP
jgi:predicted esterase